MSALYFPDIRLDYMTVIFVPSIFSFFYPNGNIIHSFSYNYCFVRKKKNKEKCPSINYHFQNCRGRHGSYSTLNNPSGANGHSTLHVRKVDSASIANMDKDCFIIPIAYLDRFLPDGVNVRATLLISNSTVI